VCGAIKGNVSSSRMLFGKFEPLAWINFAENERVCVHMRARTHARALLACMHARTHARTYVLTHTHAHTHTCTHTNAHISTDTKIHNNAPTRTHTQQCADTYTHSLTCSSRNLNIFFLHGSLGLPIPTENNPLCTIPEPPSYGD